MSGNGTLEQASSSTLLELARRIEAKDPYTAGHTWRVANYGQIVAAALDYPPDKIEAMLLAGTLHDIGKVKVPDSILTKPGRLTEEEFAIMKRHPQDGYDMLKEFPEFSCVLDVVLHHHEAYDGRGYPFGLAGEDIPHDARLFAIVDAFDAMTTNRCYRPAMSGDNAAYEIWRNRGRQFDPHISDVFLRLFREGLLDHIAGCSDLGVRIGNCPTCGPVIELHGQDRPDELVDCKVCGSSFRFSALRDPGLTPAQPAAVTQEPAPAAT